MPQLQIPTRMNSYQDNPYDKEMRTALNMDKTTMDKFRNFNRYMSIYVDDEMSSVIPYVFIVRPDLNILSSNGNSLVSPYIENDPYFQYMFRNHKEVLESLTVSLDASHDFISFLLDRTESFQLTDTSIKYYSIVQPFTGYQIFFANNASESVSGISFDITFRETNDYLITKLFNTWVYYIDGVARNMFQPRKQYVYEDKLDYASSIYYLICAPNGEDILYFAKNIGVFPVNVPHSSHSHNLHGTPENKVNVSFVGAWQEALNPLALKDFNKNSGCDSTNTSFAYIKNYNPFSNTGTSIVGAPYIDYVNGKYKLRWRAKTT